jgi:MFS family permease
MSAVCRSAVAYGFMTFLPLRLVGTGESVTYGGFAVSAYLVVGSIGAFIGGWLADRIGSRAVIIRSLAGALPMFLAYPFLPGALALPCILAGNLVLQLGLPVVVVMGQHIAPRHASTVSSMLMGAAWGVSMLLIGPAGALADARGIPVAMTALALLIVPGYLFALRLPDTREPERPDSVAAPAEPAGGAPV